MKRWGMALVVTAPFRWRSACEWNKNEQLFTPHSSETSGIVRRPKSGSRTRCRDRDAYTAAFRAICQPGDDRGRGRLGRAPPVWKRDIATGAESRDSWNQIH